MNAAPRPRALVVVDGEHYPAGRAGGARGTAVDRYEVAGGLFAGAREAARRRRRRAGPRGRSRPARRHRGRPARRRPCRRGGRRRRRRARRRGRESSSTSRTSRSSATASACCSRRPGGRRRLRRRRLHLRAAAAPAAARQCLSLNVIGTGKRVGKTAVAGHLARLLDDRLRGEGGVVVVAMGRGGPPEPEVVPGREALDAADLLAASRAGATPPPTARGRGLRPRADDRLPALRRRHGRCRLRHERGRRAAARREFRGGAGGLRGQRCRGAAGGRRRDALRRRAAQPHEYITGFLGTYRLLVSDLVVLTMCEPPFASAAAVRDLVAGVRAVKPGLDVVPTVFRPRPATPVRGRRVAFFSTAPPAALPALTAALADEHGAEVVLASTDLADRAALAGAVARAAVEADVFLTEIEGGGDRCRRRGRRRRRTRARLLRQRAARRRRLRPRRAARRARRHGPQALRERPDV